VSFVVRLKAFQRRRETGPELLGEDISLAHVEQASLTFLPLRSPGSAGSENSVVSRQLVVIIEMTLLCRVTPEVLRQHVTGEDVGTPVLMALAVFQMASRAASGSARSDRG